MYMSGCRCTRFVGMCWCVLVCVGVGITHSETKDKVRQIKDFYSQGIHEGDNFDVLFYLFPNPVEYDGLYAY